MKRTIGMYAAAAVMAAALATVVLAQTPTAVDPAGVAPIGPQVAAPGTPASQTPAVTPSNVQPNQAAVPTTEIPSPATPNHYVEGALWALMVSQFMQFLKKQTWFPFLQETTPAKVKAIWGFAFALLTAAGINVVMAGSLGDPGGATITISGLSFSAFKDIAWQWASQQAWYRVAVKEPEEVTVVATKAPEPVKV